MGTSCKTKKGGSMGKESRILQWHPAFYAGVQLELEKEGSVMSEEFESLLNEKLAMREERGRSIGLREGELKGRLEGKRTTAVNLKKINMPVEQIAEIELSIRLITREAITTSGGIEDNVKIVDEGAGEVYVIGDELYYVIYIDNYDYDSVRIGKIGIDGTGWQELE